MTKHVFVIISLTYTLLLQQATALQLTKEHFLQNLLHSKNQEFYLKCKGNAPSKEVSFEFDNDDYLKKTKYKPASGKNRMLPLSNIRMTKYYQGKASVEWCDKNGNVPLRSIHISLIRSFYTDKIEKNLKKNSNTCIPSDRKKQFYLSDSEIDLLKRKKLIDRYEGVTRSRFDETTALLESLFATLAKNGYTFHIKNKYNYLAYFSKFN